MAEINTINADYVILGGGLAGLSCAYKLSLAGKKVVIIEKETMVGGLARTIEFKGFHFDFCAHRFHTADSNLLKEIQTLMGDNFKKHFQKSRILLYGKYLKYPFDIPTLLRVMPKKEALFCIIDFIFAYFRRCFSRPELNSYADWFKYYFGSHLYKVMCYPYTRKIWGMDPEKISSDWANQRFSGVKLRSLLLHAFAGLIKSGNSEQGLADSSVAPDAGDFYYPIVGGFQALADKFKGSIEQNNGLFFLGSAIKSIEPKQREVTFSSNLKNYSVLPKEGLITTIPLHIFCNLISSPKPSPVSLSLNNLKYMDIIFVFLIINKNQISNDKWLYFPDKDICFNRSVEFKNWSDWMVKDQKTSLCLDITITEENKNIWQMSDQDLIDKCKSDCRKANLCKENQIIDAKVIKISHAYPVYNLDYRKNLNTIVGHIEGFENVYCLGRTGIFRYNNSDGAIDMGFELARRLLSTVKIKSIYEYTPEGVSL